MPPNYWQAIVNVVAKLGEKEIYLSLNGSPLAMPNEGTESYQMVIPLSNWQEYLQLKGYIFVLENIFYSPSGKWGVITYGDGFGVIGGDKQFIEEVFKNLGTTLEQECMNFIWLFPREPNTKTPQFLSYIFGEEQSAELLRKANW